MSAVRQYHDTEPTAAALAVSILLGYQDRWIADTSPVKIIEKSRRIGLSYAEAADAVLHAMASDGANVYYISFNKDMTEGFIADCATWAKSFGEGAKVIDEEVFPDPAKPDRAILKFSIAFASGNQIQAFSSNPRNLRSKGRPKEMLIIDEAAFVDDLDELLKAALAMTMWGGQVHIISTHNGDDNPFNTLIQDCRAGKYDYSVHRVTLDDALNDGLFQRICNVSGQEWTTEKEAAWRDALIKRYAPNDAEESFCVPAKGGGQYIPLALVESRMVPVGEDNVPIIRQRWTDEFGLLPELLRNADVEAWCKENLLPVLETLDKTRPHGFGEDFARHGDLTVITAGEEGQDCVLRVRLVVEISNCPYAQQRQIIKYIGDHLPNFRAAALDATGNGAETAEWCADTYGHGRVMQVKLNDNFYLMNMPKFKAALEDATLDGLPRDTECRDDMRAIKKIDGIPKLPKQKTQTGNAEKKQAQRHGDFAVSLFMFHCAMTTVVYGPIEHEAAPRRHDRYRDKDPWDDEGDMQDFKEGSYWVLRSW